MYSGLATMLVMCELLSLPFPAMSLFACAVYVYTGMWSLGKSPPQWLSQLPVAITGLAVLLGTLQPELGWEVRV